MVSRRYPCDSALETSTFVHALFRMPLTIPVSGEIHTDRRERLERCTPAAGLDVSFLAPVTGTRHVVLAARLGDHRLVRWPGT